MKAIHALHRLRESERWRWRSCSLLVLLTLTTAAANTFANPVAEAARDMESGQLQFVYAAREGVHGNGRSVSIDFGSVTTWRNNMSRSDWCNVCDIQVTLTYRHGEVRKLRWRITGQSQRQRDDLHGLGTVEASVARDFLLGIMDHRPTPRYWPLTLPADQEYPPLSPPFAPLRMPDRLQGELHLRLSCHPARPRRSSGLQVAHSCSFPNSLAEREYPRRRQGP